MQFEISEQPESALARYAEVSIAFQVTHVLDVHAVDGGLDGLTLRERAVAAPYVKDYDALGPGPSTWEGAFDVRKWLFVAATIGERWVGAAAVAPPTSAAELLGTDRSCTVLWDLRVAPEFRGKGIGYALFQRAVLWSRASAADWMVVETQTTNVPACRFYRRVGCELGALDRFAYPSLPHESKLAWYRGLTSAARVV